MEKIASFLVDHRKIREGVYISRIDGDITTYDLRTRKPNTPDLMDNATMHSVEHMFATLIRNSRIKEKVIYFGPMGCQTGFYLLIRNADNQEVLDVIKEVLQNIIDYDGQMPGKSEIECGNYRNLSVELAKIEAKRFLEKIKDNTVENLKYY
ncbi:MAG: S-ribosylhomocysteine lyase [Clostridiaceae bacterium]|nr:S-ribosylhomocysteine lyase [Clostridiaceae bacterium]